MISSPSARDSPALSSLSRLRVNHSILSVIKQTCCSLPFAPPPSPPPSPPPLPPPHCHHCRLCASTLLLLLTISTSLTLLPAPSIFIPFPLSPLVIDDDDKTLISAGSLVTVRVNMTRKPLLVCVPFLPSPLLLLSSPLLLPSLPSSPLFLLPSFHHSHFT